MESRRVFRELQNLPNKMVKSSKADGRIDLSAANAVVKAIDLVRKKSKGQYLENIAEICATEYKWSSDETTHALKVAKANNLIKEVLFNEKISYRIIESTNDNTVHVESESYESDSIADTVVLGVDGTTDFEDFKKFIQGEVLDLKSQLETRLPLAPRHVIDYERAFIKSLEHRIVSLEKQLDDKQSIINKLLAERALSNFNVLGQRGNHSTVVRDNGTYSADSKDTKTSTPANKEIKGLSKQQQSAANVSTTRNPEQQNKPRSKPAGDKKKLETSSVNGNEEQEKTQPEKKNTRKRVFIIGDSILNGISENGLNKRHDVKVRPHSGATSQDIKDHIKPIIRRKPDLIIIHAGTNDLTKGCNTVEEMNEIIEAAKSDSPSTEIVISSLTTRRDNIGMPKKVKNLNRKLNDACDKHQIKMIDNSNLGAECLSAKNLHLNPRGNSLLARNFLNFINDF